MKRKCVKALCIMMLLGLAAGGAFAKGQNETVTVKESKYISIAANPIGGSSYRMASSIADVVMKVYPELDVVAEETSGYMENITLLSEDEVEVAFSNNMLLAFGYHGSDFFEGAKKGVVTGVMALSANIMHIIVPGNSKVQSIKDIKGLRVGMGQPGGSSLVDAEYLMKVIGLTPGVDFKAYNVNASEQASMFKDGQLDVYIWNGKIPNSPAREIATMRDVRFISLEEDVIKGLIKLSNIYDRYTIPAGTYPDQPQEVVTAGNTTILAASSNVSEDAIYKFTKAFIENLPELSERDKAFTDVKLDMLLGGITIPLHPGALKYYREAKIPGIEDFVKKFQKVKP
ncbi:MAG: TAXI family TRAP transporter solute-binding subunit [Spirochaetales bacterium]|nr:TAXI family TRAP transporter solute-binding subunit [Spirochaetales bacterium]